MYSSIVESVDKSLILENSLDTKGLGRECKVPVLVTVMLSTRLIPVHERVMPARRRIIPGASRASGWRFFLIFLKYVPHYIYPARRTFSEWRSC